MIEQLPIELLYRIFDYLKFSEIFTSFSNLNTQFNRYLIGFNRYKLDFRSIDRFEFDFLCNSILPTNVRSLILSDDKQTPGQISLFLSRFQIQQFTRLQSLKLIQIEQHHLLTLIKQIRLANFICLTIETRSGSCFHVQNKAFLTFLSSIFQQAKLRSLQLNIFNYENNKYLSFLNSTSLEYLSLDCCSYREYLLILQWSPRLQVFRLNNCFLNSTNDIISSSQTFRHKNLRSLSIVELGYVHLKQLTRFLLLTPSIVYLKLIGQGRFQSGAFDGIQWETILSEHLSSLKRFHFHFVTINNQIQTKTQIDSIVNSFSSRFWKQTKCWFVECQFIRYLSQLRLYSLPISSSNLDYLVHYDTIYSSTNANFNSNQSKMVSLNLSNFIEQHNNASIVYPHFDRLKQLKLTFDCVPSLDIFQLISIRFPLCHLTEIHLNIISPKDNLSSNVINSLIDFLQELPNLETFSNFNRELDPEIVCLLAPYRIQHLYTKISRTKDMKIILQRRCNTLSTLHFQTNIISKNYLRKIQKWLLNKHISFSFSSDFYSIHLWFQY